MGRCKNNEEERAYLDSLEFDEYFGFVSLSNQVKTKNKERLKKPIKRVLYHYDDGSKDGVWLWDYELNERQREYLRVSTKSNWK